MLLSLKKYIGFETFLVFFLYSYQVKNTPFFQTLPDLTTSLAFFLLPWGLWLCKREGRLQDIWLNKILLLLILFWIWIFFSYAWGSHTFLSKSKVFVHSFFTMPIVFYGALFIGKNPVRLQRFFIGCVLCALPVVGEIFYVHITDPNPQSYIFGANYLTTGQTLGIACIILWVKALYGREPLLYLLGATLLGTGLFYTGGRGPLLATGMCLILITLIARPEKSWKDRGLLFTSLGGAVGFLNFLLTSFLSAKESFTLARLRATLDSTTGTLDESTALRLDYYASAWRAFVEHPLKGLGVGGWPTYVGEETINMHPHNIFLEIGAELGSVGLILFGGVCLVGSLQIWNLMKQKSLTETDFLLLGVLAYTGITALKSGDLNDNWVLFFMMALIMNSRQKNTLKV